MQKTAGVLTAALCLLVATRLAGAASIQGMAVDHGTGRPLARATVTLVGIAARGTGASSTARANTSGQFVFSGLTPGAYLLSAARPGFAPLRYGQKTWKSAGTPILLSDKDANLVLELRLHRLGAITGWVTDENLVGLPEQNVVVYAAANPPRLVGKAKTDDRGSYRFGELEPGRYYVRTRGEQAEGSSGSLPTFFKDAAARDDARPVDVALDQQAEDVSIQPAFGRLFRIAGMAPVPPRSSQLTVELLSDMGPVSGSVDSSGRFSFMPVAPGTYELTAEAVTPSGVELGAYRKMTIDNDQEDIRLPLTQQPEIDVDFDVQGGRQVDERSIPVLARRRGLAAGLDLDIPTRRIRPQQDTIPPGPWEISVAPPAGTYVASIASQQRSDYPSPAAANGWKQFFLAPGGNLHVVVTLSGKTAALSGRVMASSTETAAGAPVFLEPVELDSGVGLTAMRTTRTGLAGQYRFTGLPPGHYRLLSSFDFEHPDSEELQAAHATVVSLKESAEAHQDLSLFTAP